MRVSAAEFDEVGARESFGAFGGSYFAFCTCPAPPESHLPDDLPPDDPDPETRLSINPALLLAPSESHRAADPELLPDNDCGLGELAGDGGSGTGEDIPIPPNQHANTLATTRSVSSSPFPVPCHA
ncbi:hypothetical protein D9613_012654 [Agrocybe pediades]|uniref:Uncharacterized protein n=1 Tax=Agrocybe pediades TaxID=84607 RepID=A0A8H4VS56_9AGAR|nr:hypothetical protein D9613_012654 [Agrocybe pediades]